MGNDYEEAIDFGHGTTCSGYDVAAPGCFDADSRKSWLRKDYSSLEEYIRVLEEGSWREKCKEQWKIDAMERELETWRGILNNEKEEIKKPIQGTMRWGELNAMQFPVDRWRVKDLIPKGGFVILASVSGEGKTWVALDLARSIAMGINFLDDERFVTIQGRVLYIDAENPKSEIQRRGRQLGFSDTDNLCFLSTDYLNLFEEESSVALVAGIIDNKFDVVIVDTFRAVAGGLQEEKAEQIRTFFGRFKALKEHDVCIVWLDHFHKPAQFQGKKPKKENLFGSQDKTANAEILLMMTKEEDVISVYQRKNRLGKEILPFKIEMTDQEAEDGTARTTLIYAGEIDEKESKKEEAMPLIIDILGEGPKTTPEIVKIVYKDKKIAERNVREALKALMHIGSVDRKKSGRMDEYFLTHSQQEPEEPASLFVAS